MTDDSIPQPIPLRRATRAELDRLETQAADLQEQLTAERSAASAEEAAHRAQLAAIRYELARMVLACGVTIDDLARAAVDQQDTRP